MRIGGALKIDWLADLGAIGEVTQGLDAAGFDFVSSGGHVLTAAPERYADRPAPTYAVPYRDPFVLYTHLAASTRTIRFRTAIMSLMVRASSPNSSPGLGTGNRQSRRSAVISLVRRRSRSTGERARRARK